MSTALLAISYYFTPGIAGGCLWYNQYKKTPVSLTDTGYFGAKTIMFDAVLLNVTLFILALHLLYSQLLYIAQGASCGLQAHFIAVTMFEPGVQVAGVQLQIGIDAVIGNTVLCL